MWTVDSAACQLPNCVPLAFCSTQSWHSNLLLGTILMPSMTSPSFSKLAGYRIILRRQGWPILVCKSLWRSTFYGFIDIMISRTATPPASTVCLSNKTYTVQPGDTCASISKSQNVGTKDLISLNGLDLSCTKIRGGQSLCLPATCQTYLVQPGDTCNSLLDGLSGVSFAQFYAWNPTINTYCINLIAGTYICVRYETISLRYIGKMLMSLCSPPGGAYTYTMPSVTVAPTRAAITTTTWVVLGATAIIHPNHYS